MNTRVEPSRNNPQLKGIIVFRNLVILALLDLSLLTHPACAAEESPVAASADFVRLVRLPHPRITDSATPYRGGGAEATNILDGVLRSEYASHAKGTFSGSAAV